MKVKVKKLNEKAVIPFKKHESDFCYDLVATSVKHDGYVWEYGTGLAFQIDRNDYEQDPDVILDIDIRPRSSIKSTGFVLVNSEGTIDESYIGEVKVCFYKVAGGEPYKVGDRIAQIKLGKTCPIQFKEVEELNDTDRGNGGFGSTGK